MGALHFAGVQRTSCGVEPLRLPFRSVLFTLAGLLPSSGAFLVGLGLRSVWGWQQDRTEGRGRPGVPSTALLMLSNAKCVL